MTKRGGTMIGVYAFAAIGIIALIAAVFISARSEDNQTAEFTKSQGEIKESVKRLKSSVEDLEAVVSDLSVNDINPIKQKLDRGLDSMYTYTKAVEDKVAATTDHTKNLESKQKVLEQRIFEARNQVLRVKIEEPVEVKIEKPEEAFPIEIKNKPKPLLPPSPPAAPTSNDPRPSFLKRSGVKK